MNRGSAEHDQHGGLSRLQAGLCALLGTAIIALAGCAGTEETTQQEDQPPAVTEPAGPVSFQMSTDTVDVLRRGERGSGVVAPGRSDTLFSVQIGAFKDPANAATAEEQARERFSHPVLRYHDQRAGLYHIRVGRFSTRRAAEELRTTMRAAYPRDYEDSWIVRLTETE